MNDNKKSGKQIQMTRREFVGAGAALAAFTIVPRHVLAGSGQLPPSDKINIGCVGCGGMQGGSDVRSVSTENIYALCDVDESQGGATFVQHPKAVLYKDFRRMLDKEQKNLDAITITIPDFMHASVALYAMERGIAVHCQKPLTQTVWEARLLTKAQKKYPKVVTQMGNQGYSAVATRIACEIIWNGDIGDVTEVHSWNSSGFSRGITEWPMVEDVPETLDWNLWQGRAAEHTYSSKILPSSWRGFLEYGTMMIGDWGIHQLGPANWALNLSKTYPTSVECIAVEGANSITYPHYSCVTEFPEREHPMDKSKKMPPVKIFWYEGNMARNVKPPAGLTQEDIQGFNEIFVGTKGFVGTRGRGESVSILPLSKMEGYKRPPEVLKRVSNHFQDWIQACKGGDSPCSNFNIAGPYAEWMLLATISWRFPNEKLLWDGEKMRFTNNEKANEFVKPIFRKGWELKDITI